MVSHTYIFDDMTSSTTSTRDLACIIKKYMTGLRSILATACEQNDLVYSICDEYLRKT